jgi:hypothetical protein
MSVLHRSSLLKSLCPALALLATLSAAPAEQSIVNPFDADVWAVAPSPIDSLVGAALAAQGLEPAPPCSDAVFARRAYLDVIGTLPRPGELRAFFEDPRPGKRAALIDALLEREGDRRSPPRGQGRNSADRQADCSGPVPSRPLSSPGSMSRAYRIGSGVQTRDFFKYRPFM